MAISEREKVRQRAWRKRHRERLTAKQLARYHSDPAVFCYEQRERRLRRAYNRLLSGIDLQAVIRELKK